MEKRLLAIFIILLFMLSLSFESSANADNRIDSSTGYSDQNLGYYNSPYKNPFDDVYEGANYFNAVKWAYYSKPQVLSGITATMFKPFNTCNRAQVVSFLWRMKGCPEPATVNNPFSDVSSEDFFYKPVLWAYENNITLGITETEFCPLAACTRAQFVTFLWRTSDKPSPKEKENPFYDIEDGKFYFDAVLWAAENKITAGVDSTHFVPNKTINRAQTVMFLYRFNMATFDPATFSPDGMNVYEFDEGSIPPFDYPQEKEDEVFDEPVYYPDECSVEYIEKDKKETDEPYYGLKGWVFTLCGHEYDSYAYPKVQYIGEDGKPLRGFHVLPVPKSPDRIIKFVKNPEEGEVLYYYYYPEGVQTGPWHYFRIDRNEYSGYIHYSEGTEYRLFFFDNSYSCVCKNPDKEFYQGRSLIENGKTIHSESAFKIAHGCKVIVPAVSREYCDNEEYCKNIADTSKDYNVELLCVKTGWIDRSYIDINGNRQSEYYYMFEDGSLPDPLGFTEIDGNKYCFGKLYGFAYARLTWQGIRGEDGEFRDYYFGDDCALQTDRWITINEEENVKVYLTHDGTFANGWCRINGKVYYFLKEYQQPPYTVKGYEEIDGVQYYFNEEGELVSIVEDKDEEIGKGHQFYLMREWLHDFYTKRYGENESNSYAIPDYEFVEDYGACGNCGEIYETREEFEMYDKDHFNWGGPNKIIKHVKDVNYYELHYYDSE